MWFCGGFGPLTMAARFLWGIRMWYPGWENAVRVRNAQTNATDVDLGIRTKLHHTVFIILSHSNYHRNKRLIQDININYSPNKNIENKSIMSKSGCFYCAE